MGEGRASALATAESGARRAVLAMGTGVLAWIVGRQVVEAIASALIADADALADASEGIRLVLYRLIITGWAPLAVPLLGYLAGRYFRASPVGYGVAAVMGGEVFAALAQSVMLGAEGWLPTTGHVVAELVLLGAGVGLGALATGRGVRAADRAQAAAQARADARAQELEAFAQQAAAAVTPAAPPEPPAPKPNEPPTAAG